MYIIYISAPAESPFFLYVPGDSSFFSRVDVVKSSTATALTLLTAHFQPSPLPPLHTRGNVYKTARYDMPFCFFVLIYCSCCCCCCSIAVDHRHVDPAPKMSAANMSDRLLFAPYITPHQKWSLVLFSRCARGYYNIISIFNYSRAAMYMHKLRSILD